MDAEGNCKPLAFPKAGAGSASPMLYHSVTKNSFYSKGGRMGKVINPVPTAVQQGDIPGLGRQELPRAGVPSPQAQLPASSQPACCTKQGQEQGVSAAMQFVWWYPMSDSW